MNESLIAALELNSSLMDETINRNYSCYTDKDTEEVRKAELYSLTAGGKRIRSFLVNEICRVCGGEFSDSAAFALAIEMMHTFSLIHDDLPCMDDDDLRRGMPTSHKVFGEATALLAGDSLAIRSIMTAAQNTVKGHAIALKATCVLAESAGSEGMIGGQIIDMRGETEELDFDTLIKLHSKKTGCLMTASAKLGCLAAGLYEDDERYTAAVRYAENIGLAFQIIDDILDATSNASVLGKNVGTDDSRNKTTFLSFMSISDARAYAERLTEEAKHSLSVFPDSAILCDLADYLLVREK